MHWTQEYVLTRCVDGSDGPGFYLCERKRCVSKYESLGIQERRALFTAQRAKNENG